MKALVELLIIFISVLAIILIFCEIGNRYGSFTNKEGSFFMLVFWGSIIAGVFSLLYCLNKKNKDDE